MPGVCCTVAEQIAALRRIAGDKVVARIRRAPDPLVSRIVAGWPRRFDPRRALALGFKAEASFDDIIRVHIEDELGGKRADRVEALPWRGAPASSAPCSLIPR